MKYFSSEQDVRCSSKHPEIKITPHFRYWYVHLIAKKLRLFPFRKKKKKKEKIHPGESDCSQLEQIRLEKTVATWCSLCKQLLPHTQQPLCSCRREESQMQRRHTLHSERSAQGQGKTWSGVAATSAARIQGRVLSSAFMHPC